MFICINHSQLCPLEVGREDGDVSWPIGQMIVQYKMTEHGLRVCSVIVWLLYSRLNALFINLIHISTHMQRVTKNV